MSRVTPTLRAVLYTWTTFGMDSPSSIVDMKHVNVCQSRNRVPDSKREDHFGPSTPDDFFRPSINKAWPFALLDRVVDVPTSVSSIILPGFAQPPVAMKKTLEQKEEEEKEGKKKKESRSGFGHKLIFKGPIFHDLSEAPQSRPVVDCAAGDSTDKQATHAVQVKFGMLHT